MNGDDQLLDVGTPDVVVPIRPVTLTSMVADFLARRTGSDDSAVYERAAQELLEFLLRSIGSRVAERMGDFEAALKVALETETRALDAGGIGLQTHGKIQAHVTQPPKRKNDVGYDEVASMVLVALDVLRMMR